MTCLEVRERLTEYALGLLSRVDATEVERHLDWCAGCRKESAELEEGAARMALALPMETPRGSLETQDVDRVRSAAGRIPVGGHRRAARLVALALAAALLAVGATGWAIAERRHVQTLQQQVTATEAQLHRVARALNIFKGQAGTIATARLSPSPGGRGSGSAVIFSAPGVQDQIVVGMVLPAGARGPYTVQLVDDRSAIKIDGLQKTVSGDWFMWKLRSQDLSRVVTITILDSTSGTVLKGRVIPLAH